MSASDVDLRGLIRDVPDFPKPGIVFKDITPLLADAAAFRHAIERLAEPFRDRGLTKVAGIESRGFLFAAAIAREIGAGIVIVRKPGKLPWKAIRHEYDLEYGSDALEIHEDAVARGERVVLVDDVLATGGTAAAATELLRRLGAEVEALAVLIELGFLSGRDRLPSLQVHSLIRY